jgi:hypothetical protein
MISVTWVKITDVPESAMLLVVVLTIPIMLRITLRR